MSHIASINSLLLNFKRENEGAGIACNQALTILISISVAYTAPLPNNGPLGASSAYNNIVRKRIIDLVSDVNEIMLLDTRSVTAFCEAIYYNRYNHSWSPFKALESFTIKQIVESESSDIVWPKVVIWLEKFVDTVNFYFTERDK